MNDEHLLQLLKNQTTVVEKTVNILKRNEGELQNEQFKNFTVRVKKTMDEYAAASFFPINDFYGQLNILSGIIYDCHNRKINHHLLPPKQLAGELEFIAGQVKHKYRVPDANAVYNIISMIFTHVTKNQILFHLSVPLLNLNEYDLFRIVPIPQWYFWVIDAKHEYLIVSGNRRTYQCMSEFEIHDCTEYNKELICTGPLHWNTNNVQQCEWSVFSQISNDGCVFERDLHESMWFSMGENRQVFHKTIESSGVLSFEQNCTIGNANMEINAHRKIIASFWNK